MLTDLMSLSTFSSVMSLFNSSMSVLTAYQYKKGTSNILFKIMPIIMLTYLTLDTCIHIYNGGVENIQFILHHIFCIFFTLWGKINNYGIDNFSHVLYILILTESSTFFLNSNVLIKKYLNFTSKSGPTLLKTILEKISVLNYVIFIPLFIYTRFNKVFSDILFNPEFYTSLLSPRDDIYHYLNRGILVFILAFTILNFYWIYLILISTSKKLMKFIKSKMNPDDKKAHDDEFEEEDFRDPRDPKEKKEKKKEKEPEIKEDPVPKEKKEKTEDPDPKEKTEEIKE